jgi:hypothetical protein
MGSVMVFSPEQAWQAALGQVQMEMPRASFDTWVRPVRLLSFAGGVFQIDCTNEYGRDWLESRLTTKLERILSALLGQEISVAFVVEETDLAEEEYIEDFEPDDLDEAVLDLDILHDSLRNMLLEPERVVRIPVYFLRWLPYVGARTVFLAATLWQLHYLSSGGKTSGGNPRVSACAEQVCQWAGVSRAQFFRCLQPGGALGWFASKCETDYEIDRRSGRTRKSANKYLLYHLPLTPGDAEDLKVYLLASGIHQFPKEALQAALEVDPRQILQYPLHQPPEGFRSMTPHDLSVQGVVRDLLGKRLDGELSDLADRLAERLQGSADFILVSWYFLKYWLPRLGHDAAMWVLVLRNLCYFNDTTGEIRDEVWIEGGYEAIAEQLGLANPRQVATWFPAVIERGRQKETLTESSQAERDRRQRFQELLGLFVQRVGYRANANGSFAWKFKVARGDPLTPEDVRLQQTASTLLIRAEDAGLLEDLFAWLEGAAPGDLAATARGNACFETLEIDPMLELRPTQASNACSETLKVLLKDCFETLEGETNACFETLLKILKRVKDSENHKETSPHQDTEPDLASADLEKVVAAVIGMDGNWSLEKLLQRADPKNRKTLLSQENSVFPFVSWILHGAAQESIQNPYSLAIARLRQNPGVGAGGAALRLANLPPHRLAEYLKQHLGRRTPEDSDWRLLFGEVSKSRIRLLVDVLGLELDASAVADLRSGTLGFCNQ